MKSGLWLIGGTGESAALVSVLLQQGFTLTVTVTTPEAQCLYPANPNLTAIVTQFTLGQLREFLVTQGIRAIVDASHPFAQQITKTAVDVAQQLNLPYLRFERPSLALPENGVEFADIESLLTSHCLHHKRVLLTIGAKWLPQFHLWHDHAMFFARILPRLESLKIAVTAGFSPDRIIALRPPVSAALEKALWQQWQIHVVVTKASGDRGGELMKQQVAQSTGVQFIRIARPGCPTEPATDSLETVITFCQKHCDC